MALISRMIFLSGRTCFGGALLNINSISLKYSSSKILSSLSSKSAGFNFYRFLQSSSDENKQTETPQAKLSQRARLKQTIRDYGATIIVFHVVISLASLGICYVAVSNGVDATLFLQRIGLPDSIVSNSVAVGGSTFVIAYALHKVFAPVRMAITISAAPLLVRYLRRINVLKPPKQKL